MAITDSLNCSLVLVALLTFHNVLCLPHTSFNQEPPTSASSSNSQLSAGGINTTEDNVITSGSDVIIATSNVNTTNSNFLFSGNGGLNTTETNSASPTSLSNVSTTDDVTAMTATSCPVFPVVKKHGQLHFQLKPDYCHMTVGVVRQPGRTIQNVLTGNKKTYVHLPVAQIKHVKELHSDHSQASQNTTNADVTGQHVMCPDYPIRNVGLITVVDTVPGRCQIALGVRLKKVDDHTDVLKKRFKYVPVYEYLNSSIII